MYIPQFHVRQQSRNTASRIYFPKIVQSSTASVFTQAPRLRNERLSILKFCTCCLLQLLAHWRSSRNCIFEMRKLIGDGWAFGNQEVYWWDREEERDFISLAVIEELDEIELGHPVGCASLTMD
jgi:hypothetical protein